jgi:hypothetical protein
VMHLVGHCDTGHRFTAPSGSCLDRLAGLRWRDAACCAADGCVTAADGAWPAVLPVNRLAAAPNTCTGRACCCGCSDVCCCCALQQQNVMDDKMSW